MGDWDPQLYLKFKSERTQPSIDLVARIRIENPGSVIDIGCGPGNSTQILHRRWPAADIVGLDISPRMIARAKEDYPDQHWQVGDAAQLPQDQRYDIVFSNATLQWIPDHSLLIPHLFGLVRLRGAMALQVPADRNSAIHTAFAKVAGSKRWSRFMTGRNTLTYESPEFYYDALRPHSDTLDIWETTYYHVLTSHGDILDFYRPTGLRPFLERLSGEEERKDFEHDVLQECIAVLPPLSDGKVLFPFKRLFVIAYRT